jgi:uncharacterized cupin superfamily protein
MPNVLNRERMPDDFVDDPAFVGKMQTLGLSELAGSERLYVHIDRVKPGGASAKYHAHSAQEEFFLVLKGKGRLRLGDAEYDVGPGDFFAKPAGKGLAHQFLNNGDEVLEILDCGLAVAGDVITYPDESVVLIKPGGAAFRRTDALAGWSSDPNA